MTGVSPADPDATASAVSAMVAAADSTVAAPRAAVWARGTPTASFSSTASAVWVTCPAAAADPRIAAGIRSSDARMPAHAATRAGDARRVAASGGPDNQYGFCRLQ